MNINILLYNILFIILLVILIYIFIYINNKSVETFIDGEATTEPPASLSSNSAINSANTVNTPPVTTFIYERKPWEYTGVNVETSVPSAEYLQCYFDVFKSIPAAKVKTPFTSGYYWINFGDYTVGNVSSQTNNKYTYCLLDKEFDGGGWMLAMRAVKNSKTFHYNSPYWTAVGTLNDNAEYIYNNIGYTESRSNEAEINTQLNNVSSIGNAIYTANTTDDSAKYDAKFEAFDKYPAREWLIIYYIDNNNKKGGDYKNNRGWVWHERNLPRNAQNKPYTAREIFSGAHLPVTTTERTTELQLSTRENYGGANPDVDIKTLKKFYKNYNTSGIPTPAIWSPQNGYNWYGINYNHNASFNRNEPRLMRLGMTFNDTNTRGNNRVVAGIGLNYNGTTAVPPNSAPNTYNVADSFSAGNFVLRYENEAEGVKRNAIADVNIPNTNLGKGDIDTSFAFEFYVR